MNGTKKGIKYLVLSLLLVFVVFAEAGRDAGAAAEPDVVHPNAQIYQAEDASLSGGARQANDHTGYTGSSFVGGFDNSGSSRVEFNVNVQSAGTYYLSIRYSAGDVGGWPKNRTVGFSVNNASENLTFIGTDSTWNTWEELMVKRELRSGNNIVALYCITSHDNSDSINIDKLSVWKHSDNPVADALYFTENEYNVSTGSEYPVVIKEINIIFFLLLIGCFPELKLIPGPNS